MIYEQESAMHKSELMVANLNIQTIADSVTTVSGAAVDHAQRIENLKKQMTTLSNVGLSGFQRCHSWSEFLICKVLCRLIFPKSRCVIVQCISL